MGKPQKDQNLGLVQRSNQQLEWLAKAPPDFCFQMDENIGKITFLIWHLAPLALAKNQKHKAKKIRVSQEEKLSQGLL